MRTKVKNPAGTLVYVCMCVFMYMCMYVSVASAYVSMYVCKNVCNQVFVSQNILPVKLAPMVFTCTLSIAAYISRGSSVLTSTYVHISKANLS